MKATNEEPQKMMDEKINIARKNTPISVTNENWRKKNMTKNFWIR